MNKGSLQDLEIYQLSFKLNIKVHEMTKTLPQYEICEQGRQIRRSSQSVFSNIAEGYGRRKYKAEFIKHLIYSQASCDETIAHLQMISAIHYKDDPLTELINEYQILGRKINTFLKYVSKHWR